MNIKHAPCLARIVAPGNKCNGWIVQVHGSAPVGSFRLPDGYPAHNHEPQSWVCESLMHSSFVARLDTGGSRTTRFIVIQDRGLRPLPGDEVPEQITESTPEQETA